AYTYTNASTYTSSPWEPLWDMLNNGAELQFSNNASYAFATPGTYTIKLTMDSAGCKFSRTRTVTVTASSNVNCSGVGFEDMSFSDAVSLQPNPTNGNLNITVNGIEKNLSIRVYNVIGSEVKSFISNEISSVFSKNFDFNDLSNGTYLVKIQTGNKSAVKRLTVSK
ncbi:MAG: T9SS type A sorting domain-containing protein, partial [Bacteroidota bacterium]